jgi:phage shock protein A
MDDEMGKKVKGFFERPEGTTGLIFIGLGVLAFLVAGNVIMPYIIAALANTLYAGLLGGTLLGVVSLVMNKKFRTLCSSFFKSSMRWLTGLFITIDPIGILKNYTEDMRERLSDIDSNIAKLNGQKKQLARTIEEERSNSEQSAKLASVAKKKGEAQAVAANMRKAARSQDFVKKLEKTHEKMEFLYRILMKMRNSVNFLLDDTTDQVRIMEAEYKSIKAAHKAMRGAEALVQGDSAKELFDQSCEFIAEDIANKLGEMETFMELSEGFMTNVDLQNGVWDEEGMKMLEQWEKTGTLLSYEDQRTQEPGIQIPKVRVASVTGQAENEQAEDEAQAAPQSNQFESFFKKG